MHFYPTWILLEGSLLSSSCCSQVMNNFTSLHFSCSVVSDSCDPWTAVPQASLPSLTSRAYWNSSIESVMPSNRLILCHPLLLPPSIIPSIRVFSNESVLRIRWSKYWSFSFNISPSNEYSGLISFRMDWLDLLAVQGTLRSLLQHHSSKASILRGSAFFIVQLLHSYMTIGKTKVLTRWTFVGKVMSLLFNMLSRLVIAFLPRSKCLLISWLQSPSVVILEPPKIQSVTVISKSFVIFDGFKDFTFVKPKCVKHSTSVASMCLCLIVHDITCLLTFWCCSTNKYLFLFFACFSTLLIPLALNKMHIF